MATEVVTRFEHIGIGDNRGKRPPAAPRQSQQLQTFALDGVTIEQPGQLIVLRSKGQYAGPLLHLSLEIIVEPSQFVLCLDKVGVGP